MTALTALCLLLTSKLATSMLGADADRRPAHALVEITSRADDYVPRAAETDNSTIAELAFSSPRLYRLGDIVWRFRSPKYALATYQVSEPYVCGLWPASLGCRYLHVCGGDRRFNKRCFISLLDLRRPATRAAAGAVLVHLRTGDMLVRGDCAAEPPCLHDGKATPTAAGYRSILPRLPLPNASSVTVVYSTHFQLPPERERSAGEAEAAARMYSARSDGYALAVGRVFEAAGHEVRYRRTEAASSSADAAASADADILSAAAAGTFVRPDADSRRVFSDSLSNY